MEWKGRSVGQGIVVAVSCVDAAVLIYSFDCSRKGRKVLPSCCVQLWQLASLFKCVQAWCMHRKSAVSILIYCTELQVVPD